MIQNIPHGGRARELEAMECLGGKPPLAPPLYARLSGALQPRGSSKNTEQVLVQYRVVQSHKVQPLVVQLLVTVSRGTASQGTQHSGWLQRWGSKGGTGGS